MDLNNGTCICRGILTDAFENLGVYDGVYFCDKYCHPKCLTCSTFN